MSHRTLLVELGTEELPPTALKTLGLAFRDGITAGLAARKLDYGAVQWFATPRRLAVLIDDVAAQAAQEQAEVLGPPADRARDAAGNWSPAAVGFARKQGVAPDDLLQIDTPKGPRLGLRVTHHGASAKESLNAIINESIQALPIAKRMRWGARREEFVRPVHWVVAMLDDDHSHGEILGIATGNVTRGHRFHSDHPITLTHPHDYENLLADARVVASFERRRQMITDQVEVEASALKAQAIIDPALLDEVTGLVEWPVALTGSFEERFLEVPQEALISSMKVHQKYFHLVDARGALLPNFITICNIESRDPAQVIAGNERVIRPRLSDAAFFYEQDRATPLADRVPTLENVVFQQQLGTVRQKTARLMCLVRELATALGVPADPCERAAMLSKADLVSELVQEFPDLQGIAGAYYAKHDGEAADVAAALQQQYWPRFAGDALPQGATASCLALADRLDTLVGVFAIGQQPTGSRDPFALRRASLAVLRIIVEQSLDLDLRACLQHAAAQYPEAVGADETAVDLVLAYMLERFRAWFEDEGVATESFRAVQALGLTRPLDIYRRVHAVHAFSQLPEAASLAAANKRVANILGKLDAGHVFTPIDTGLLQEPAEQALRQAMQVTGAESAQHVAAAAYGEALATLAALREPVDTFFDDVMVNAEDSALRSNRLSLLHALRGLFLQVADISELVVTR